MMSVIMTCSDDVALYNIVVPAGLAISGAHSAHHDHVCTLTILALDEEGNGLDEACCRANISISAGMVSPSTVWLEGARSDVQLTIKSSGLVTLRVEVGDVSSGPFEIFVDDGRHNDNILAVVATESIWDSLKSDLAAYLSARNADGWGIHLLCFTETATIEEVREALRKVGSPLKGAFFAGDLPAAWFTHEGEEFPIDLYFMDLDGTWVDSNNDGMFEDHIGEVKPDIFLGRIAGPEAKLKTYFKRIERYRAGEYSLPNRFMAYVDDDWTSFHYGDQPYYYGLEQMFGAQAVDLVYDSMETISPDYQARLTQGHQLMQIMAHSDWTLSQFSMSPANCVTYAHTYLSVPGTTEACFSLKTSDPFKLYLNGALVAEVPNPKGTNQAYFTVPITLLQGTNRVLLKIAQGMYYSSYDRFNFTMVVHDGQWQSIPGLEQQSSPPQSSAGGVGGYLTGWLLSGPYNSSTTSWWNLLQKDFIGGEAEADPQQSSDWVEYQSPIPNINLREAFNNIPNESVAYAYARVYSPSYRAAFLSLGYKNNGIAVWLNGERVVFLNNYDYDNEGFQSDRLLVPVLLRAGPNRLMIKVRNWWTNDFAFSVRFVDEAGTPFDDLSFDPAADNPLDYDPIVKFLVIGVFPDDDADSRFNTDYLGNESGVEPDEGDQHNGCFWKKFDALKVQIDLNNQSFFGLDGGEFTYDQIAQINPKVHFYNQFNCSGARYVEDPCMGYNYILDSDYGLNSVGSTKSGSMLNFEDFYTPLAQGKTFGQSFLEWFQINGESSWAWFYGMTLLGDPTLTIEALPTSNQLSIVDGPVEHRRRFNPDDPLIQALWSAMKEEAARQSLLRPPLSYDQYMQERRSRYAELR